MRTNPARSQKPLLVSWPDPPKGVYERLGSFGIYPFIEPARVTRALGQLVKRNAAIVRSTIESGA